MGTQTELELPVGTGMMWGKNPGTELEMRTMVWEWEHGTYCHSVQL